MTAVVPGVRHIVVLRANALGDYLLAEPALRALRAAYPASRITLVGAAWQPSFLKGRPGPVDDVWVLPQVEGLAAQPAGAPPADELPAFCRRVRDARPDIALQMHGGGAAANPVTLSFGARVTAGMRAPGAVSLDRELPYRYYQHEVARHLEVAALVGAEPGGTAPRLELTDADHREARAVLPSQDGAPMAALHPGVGDPRRRWPGSSFAAVADALADSGARVLLTGAPGDAELTAEIAARCHAPVHDLTGRTGLGALGAVYARCALVVGVDTGPLHLARAVGAATVTVFWCGNAFTAAPFDRRRQRVLIGWILNCPECGAACHGDVHPHRGLGPGCEHRSSWVADVPTAEVIEEALDLLEAR